MSRNMMKSEKLPTSSVTMCEQLFVRVGAVEFCYDFWGGRSFLCFVVLLSHIEIVDGCVGENRGSVQTTITFDTSVFCFPDVDQPRLARHLGVVFIQTADHWGCHLRKCCTCSVRFAFAFPKC